MSVMNMPIDHAPSHTSSRHTSTPRTVGYVCSLIGLILGVPLKPRLLAREA